jgi:hypothetical protein
MLAAGYANESELMVAALVPDFRRFPVDAIERRDAFLVSAADAAVVVRGDRAAVRSFPVIEAHARWSCPRT